MLVDLTTSFLSAFGMITVVMIVLMLCGRGAELRGAGAIRAGKVLLFSTIAGLLAMVPNILPCVGVLGLMGIINVPLEIGSILTASVALGVAVDDTLHFTTWFRRGLSEGRDRVQSVLFAYQRCGAAMTQTSLVCGLGLLVYAISPFVPMARFAWLMFAILMFALLADLVVMPAILVSPLGRFFEPFSWAAKPTIRAISGITRTHAGERRIGTSASSLERRDDVAAVKEA
jgi:hypothetical protein